MQFPSSPREQIARPSAFATETSSSRGAVMMVWSQSEKRRKHHEHLWKQRSIPIGSVCMPYMVTSKPSIYPNFVSINLPLTYGSVMGYVIVSRRQRWQWRWPSPVSAARYPLVFPHLSFRAPASNISNHLKMPCKGRVLDQFQIFAFYFIAQYCTHISYFPKNTDCSALDLRERIEFRVFQNDVNMHLEHTWTIP